MTDTDKAIEMLDWLRERLHSGQQLRPEEYDTILTALKSQQKPCEGDVVNIHVDAARKACEVADGEERDDVTLQIHVVQTLIQAAHPKPCNCAGLREAIGLAWEMLEFGYGTFEAKNISAKKILSEALTAHDEQGETK